MYASAVETKHPRIADSTAENSLPQLQLITSTQTLHRNLGYNKLSAWRVYILRENNNYL